jgi:large subunit ribosomal protein L31
MSKAMPATLVLEHHRTLRRWTGCHPLWHTEITPVRRFTPRCGDPVRLVESEHPVKAGIHPAYVETTVHCSCGATFQTRSTKTDGDIHADVCSQCHPFYTGKQKIIDTGGRVQRFEQRYGKRKPTGGK